MKPINFGIWSGTDDKGLILDILSKTEVGGDIRHADGIVPFKDYSFKPGEYAEIVRELNDLNPDYSVFGYTKGSCNLIIIANKLS